MTEYQEEILAYFGYWPVFCDGQVVSFERNADDIALKINYIDTDKALGALVKMTFHGVSDVDLSEHLPGSVVDTLKILSGNLHRVSIEPCYGLGGSFKCKKIRASIVNA
ncbi:Imm50 family immunity protein [Marinimicrobium sp. LS-A18]|uniref:Imm50 family immunity protein n=1 Tax=Marinimicrobium sp. LS-A18 TaxID=1381596 RepID=UPI00187BCE74|nr:Imm50 family immunity protein [Marinimicrobium sp. LS-A18]